jgi:hypothetical protein
MSVFWLMSRLRTRLARLMGKSAVRNVLGVGALLVLCASTQQAASQTADLAGVLPGDRWAYDVTDEITGDLKQTTSIVVLSLSDSEINTRVMSRGAARPIQIAFDRSWNRLDDDAWRYKPSDGTVCGCRFLWARSGVSRPRR